MSELKPVVLRDCINNVYFNGQKHMSGIGDRNILRVLHTFYAYLQTTENWAFRLIDHLPDTDVIIASKQFLECPFYAPRFKCIKFPIKYVENSQGTFFLKMVNKIVSLCLLSYPLYVMRKAENCDLMHSHFAPVGWQYMNLAKRLRIPHVVSFYGSDYEFIPFRQPAWKNRYIELFKTADIFLCEGSYAARKLKTIGCPPEKIRIAPLGVEVAEIPFWERTKREKELNLVQIAAFKAKKGHTYTIEAFKHALEECPNMTLTLVGGDPLGLKCEFQKQIKNTPADGKVFFLDAVNFDKLHTFMKNYHVFIHPSLYTNERDCEGGAPIVLLDAQATGMPVIATTHCDIPAEVVHGKTGLLSPEKDHAYLARSIQVFYNMGQNEYKFFCANARRHIEQNYDICSTSKGTRSIYDNLMRGRIDYGHGYL